MAKQKRCPECGMVFWVQDHSDKRTCGCEGSTKRELTAAEREEVRVMYRQAKYPKVQIQILQDLYLVPEVEILRAIEYR